MLNNQSNDRQVLILIPMLNEEKYIERCIGSIGKQSHQNWITYISDNFSNDSSLEIVQGYASTNEKFRIVKRIDRVGAEENWNDLAEKALNETSPDFVMWLGADDFLENIDYLKNMTENCVKDGIVPSFKNCREDGSYYLNHIFSIDCTFESKIANHFRFARNWANVVAIYGLYKVEVFTELLQGNSSRLTDSPESDWWWTFTLHNQFKVTSSPTDFYVKTIKKTPFYSITGSNNSAVTILRKVISSNLNLRLLNQAVTQKHRITTHNFLQFCYTFAFQLIFMATDKILRLILPSKSRNLGPR